MCDDKIKSVTQFVNGNSNVLSENGAMRHAEWCNSTWFACMYAFE